MLQKLMLAVTMTFVLNLFLSVRFPANTQTVTKDYLAELPTTFSAKISILNAPVVHLHSLTPHTKMALVLREQRS